MAARPPMPARRSVPPPPARTAAPAPAVDEDAPILVIPLRVPLRQLRDRITEIRVHRRPVLADLMGYEPGIAKGLTTHCVEMAAHLLPKISQLAPVTVGKIDAFDVMAVAGQIVPFWTDSPTTGVSVSESSASGSAGDLETR